jgi:hypothetical protein
MRMRWEMPQVQFSRGSSSVAAADVPRSTPSAGSEHVSFGHRSGKPFG